MKKLFSLILCCVLVVTLTACSGSDIAVETTSPTETQPQITETDLKAKIAKKIEIIGFEGIVYLTHNGEDVYCQTDGKDEKGGNLTLDTPMYIGSISKQFCAVAVMMLSQQGKLSVEDTLDKYFPDYEIGKDITIQNLLSMRSGIPDHTERAAEYLHTNKSESENLSVMKDWLFSQPLNFEPGTEFGYTNSNYALLSLIVEQVSGQHYQSFIRDNIFEPIGMTNSGFISEVETNPNFSKSLSYDTFILGEDAAGMARGAGDIVSTAHDMDKWMTALKSGKVISEETFEEMIVDRSADNARKYGYGFEGMYQGVGHAGQISVYWALEYMNSKQDYNLFVAGINADERIGGIPEMMMSILIEG